MGFCDNNKLWGIDLILDSDTTKIERLQVNVQIDGNGQITGEVKVSNGEVMSRLGGRCEGPQIPGVPVALMTFIFRVKKAGIVWGVHMSGVAHPPEANPKFRGKLRTFVPDINTPASSGVGELQSISLLGDPGDTGTGTGQQT